MLAVVMVILNGGIPLVVLKKSLFPRSVEVALKNLDLAGWVRILAGEIAG